MSTHNGFPGDDDWTPDENALLASLPAEKSPSGDLKRRTLEAVRRQHLAEPSRVASLNRRFALLAAAATIVFVAGALVGYAAGRRTAPATDQAQMSTRQAVAQAESATTNSQPVRHVVWY